MPLTRADIAAQAHQLVVEGYGLYLASNGPVLAELETAPFGAAVHVSGTDRRALEAAIAPWRKPPFKWSEVEPTLEDVFIKLMGQAQDNFA